MADEIKVYVKGDTDVPKVMADTQDSVRKTEKVIVSSMGTSEAAFDTAARSSGKFGEALDAVSGTAGALAGGLGDLGDSFSAVRDLQNLGAQRADDYKRKQLDVAQAMQDSEQAAGDLKQAQIDLNQSQVDAKQAAADAEQAQLDVKQALIDASTAQEDYNKAVKENGPNSSEAKQAAQDLAQAQQDLKQANIDSEQAQVDLTQAQSDSEQATRDMSQAGIDAKTAQVDLNEAQREAQPPTGYEDFGATLSALGPIIMGVSGAVDLLMVANNLLTGTIIAQGFAWVGQKVIMVASTVQMGIMTAAQWALNAAMSANPIMLVVIAIGALVAAVIWIATKTTWFSDLWHAIWGAIGGPVTAAWNAVKTATSAVVDFIVRSFQWVIDLPGKIGAAFRTLGDILLAPFRTAFNAIARFWNNTLGRINFSIPSWVPFIGGNSFGFPRIPELATGGDVMRTGAAIIHKGERIVPAGTRGLGSGGGSDPTIVEIRLVGGPEEFRRWMKKNTRLYGGRGDDSVQLAWGG